VPLLYGPEDRDDDDDDSGGDDTNYSSDDQDPTEFSDTDGNVRGDED